MKQCPSCYKIVDDEMNFCPGCGQKLEEITKASESNTAATRYHASREAEMKKAAAAREAAEQKHTRRHWVVGATVTFGSYYQNDFNTKEPIEWIICETNGKYEACLISKYVLECRAFDISHIVADWVTSDLRAWLNKTFLKNAFTLGERKRIVRNERPEWRKRWGRRCHVYDKVSIPGYFGKKDLSWIVYQTRPMTKIAEQELERQGLKNPQSEWWGGYDYKGEANYYALSACSRASNPYVTLKFERRNCNKEDMSIGVRPAIWVKMPKA